MTGCVRRITFIESTDDHDDRALNDIHTHDKDILEAELAYCLETVLYLVYTTDTDKTRQDSLVLSVSAV